MDGVFQHGTCTTNAYSSCLDVFKYFHGINSMLQSFYFRNVTENVMARTGAEGKSYQKRIKSRPPYFSNPIIGGSRCVPPPLGQIFFHFHAVFGKKSFHIIGFWPVFRGWRSPPSPVWKILDPPLLILTPWSLFYRSVYYPLITIDRCVLIEFYHQHFSTINI